MNFKIPFKSRIKEFVNSLRERPIGYEQGIYKRPWDFPELMLFELLYKAKEKQNIFIIGGSYCDELENLSRTNKLSNVVILEPSSNEKTLFELKKNIEKYHNKSILIKKAASFEEGKSEFFKTNIEGTSSLLKLGRISKEYHSLKQKESMEVELTTLDKVSEETEIVPNILWIDVQGAELMVLNGAKNILKSVDFIFLETSIFEPCYENGCTFQQIYDYLNQFGFFPLQLGSDIENGTGNALFAKSIL